jgi:hypothetical protein
VTDCCELRLFLPLRQPSTEKPEALSTIRHFTKACSQLPAQDATTSPSVLDSVFGGGCHSSLSECDASKRYEPHTGTSISRSDVLRRIRLQCMFLLDGNVREGSGRTR